MENEFLCRQNERLLQQVAALEAAAIKHESASSDLKARFAEEHAHRQVWKPSARS